MKSPCFVLSSLLQKRSWPLDASFLLAEALSGRSVLALEWVAQGRGHKYSVLRASFKSLLLSFRRRPESSIFNSFLDTGLRRCDGFSSF